MFSIIRVLLVIVVFLLVQFVDGNQRNVRVSDHKLISDGSFDCCVLQHGNCTCNSFADALDHLGSNVLINITTNIKLLSLIKKTNLENVSIVGHNNPTVKCENGTGIHFNLCYNCIIQGITWHGCGTKTKPGIKFSSSSNITIKNCLFHYSKGQTVVLSGVQGDVNIHNCDFANNTHYRGDGSAIHYLNHGHQTNYQPLFAISHCTFFANKHSRSLVYIENRIINLDHNITFYSSKFHHNQGISIYVTKYINIYINGKSFFLNNLDALFIKDYSTVTFGVNSVVKFIQNSQCAVFLTNFSSIIFDKNSVALFSLNEHFNGVIYADVYSNIILKATSQVAFTINLARHDAGWLGHGGAIYSNTSYISFEGNASVVFSNNLANNHGGAIYLYNSFVYFKGNSSILFDNNTANSRGGALYSYNSSISIGGNSCVVFKNNNANYSGGVYSFFSYIYFKGNASTIFSNNIARLRQGGSIYSFYGYVAFSGNSSTVFTNNRAPSGGAIYVYRSVANGFKFEENASTVFNNNTSISGGGGAIYLNITSIFFKGTSSTVFSNNNAYGGGAIVHQSHIDGTYISFEGNASTVFNNNIAEVNGGAIYYIADGRHVYISFNRNSSTVFINNNAIGYSLGKTYGNRRINGFGGAIYAKHSDSTNRYIYFEGNASIVFSNNTADLYGGALYLANINICFKGHSTTVFSYNSANVCGGAISSRGWYPHNISILFEEFSATIFIHNTAEKIGGAIHSEYIYKISFKANSTTKFSSNTADEGGAIYFKSGNVSFEGFSITEFNNNAAYYGGGALFTNDRSDINFCDDSTANFTNNKARYGAVFFSYTHSKIMATGNFTVIFNDVIPKWCNNMCLRYPRHDVVVIENNGHIWCNNRKIFTCLTKHCYCKKLENLFQLDALKNNSLVNITESMTLSSTIELIELHNFSIVGHNNITVFCDNGGHLYTNECSNLKVEGITWIGCGSHEINYTGGMLIQNCTFQYSRGPALTVQFNMKQVNINHCNFMNNNNYKEHGAAIQCTIFNDLKNIESSFTFNITNCNFGHNGNASSILSFKYYDENVNSITHIYLSNSNFQNNQGISVYLPHNNFILHINGETLFENNVAQNGAGIYIGEENSVVIFHKRSKTKFLNNSVDYNGAAIFLNYHSSVTFEQNSCVEFNDNKATNGTIYSKASSKVTFKATCLVKFDGNSAIQHGSAIHSFDNSHVIFKGKSSVTLSNNVISSNDILDPWLGGTVFSENNGYVSFEENSFTVFSNNSANFGSAILSLYNSNVTFKDQSKVMFNGNTAQSCGVLTSIFSSINYNDDAIVTYNTNVVSYTLTNDFEISAGTMCTFQRTTIIITGHSSITFVNNRAAGNGAMVLSESDIIIEGYSAIIFKNNIAQYTSGGAFMCTNNSNVTIKGSSNVTFDSNKAGQSGGAIHSYNKCNITFKDNSTLTFINNNAINNGGAIFCRQPSQISFEGNSMVTFDGNIADYGGALYSANSTIIFKDASIISFYNNVARRSGGVGYFSLNSKTVVKGTANVTFENNMGERHAGVFYCIRSNIMFKENSTITLTHNRALDGGAFLANDHCNITVTENSTLSFTRNEAAWSGGAGYLNSHCNFIVEGNVQVTFDNNRAYYGGAVCANNDTRLTLKGNSTIFFYNNVAAEGGGAVNVSNDSRMSLKDNIAIEFIKNNAQYGGAICLDTTSVMVNASDKKNSVKFTKKHC